MPIADSGAPIKDETGHVRGVVLVFRDVTAERAMEDALMEREERLRLMIDSVKDYAIFMLDPEGRVASWNSGAERIKGYTSAEILGRHFSVFYTDEDRLAGKPDRELRVAAANGRVEDEGWRLRKDGSKILAHVVISPVRDDKGQLRGFAKVVRDMTERRRIEEEFREQRTRAIAAQLALKERDEFISVAAHELRTPLTVLQLKLQGVENAIPEGLTVSSGRSTVRSRLEAAVKQTRRLGELVERLLNVSRIVAGKLEMKLEDVDLSDLVRQAVDDFRESALQVGSEVRFAARHAVKGEWDRLRIEEVIANLLSNAVKYGGGKPIEVYVDDTGDQGRIVVSDQGIGIAAENKERIFERFERAVSGQHFSGLGLGLYIARYIAEAHGGSVKAESAGQGSTFVVELPKRTAKGKIGGAPRGTTDSGA
jgi:PAS domain S-box-containing protein